MPNRLICSRRAATMGRPIHTYSIVARDAASGELGVAVQSHWFSVGPLVAWAAAGVGAVATQSFVEPAYGPRLLGLLGSGLSAEAALSALVTVDPGREVRQVALVDAAGRVAVHTGARCIAAAGHIAGEGFSVQANMMLNEAVVPAMAAAYAAAEGPLAARLLSTLHAAQDSGGDIRGQQSAALVVVRGHGTGQAAADTVVDLRVDDHPAPLTELDRLWTLQQAYTAMNAGDAALELADLAAAAAHYDRAASLAPGQLEMVYWQAVGMASVGQLTQALPRFRQVFAADANWVELTRRLPAAGLLPSDEAGRALLATILAEAG